MLRRAEPDGGIVQLAGRLVDVFDQALEIGRRRCLRHRQHEGGIGEYADRREIVHRVVGHLLDHHRRDRVPHADRERGVAVLRRLRDDAAGDGAAGARPVLDHELLAQDFRQPVGDDAGRDVGAAAGAEADQDANRPCRPVLRRGGRRLSACHRKGCDRHERASNEHSGPPRFFCPIGSRRRIRTPTGRWQPAGGREKPHRRIEPGVLRSTCAQRATAGTRPAVGVA